ncbi:hypothetical protein TNCV_3734011 [Trichonephila clavipes]|nr:hypothetical protein TNCV_3734011 [Trichonephila clavipes]
MRAQLNDVMDPLCIKIALRSSTRIIDDGDVLNHDQVTRVRVELAFHFPNFQEEFELQQGSLRSSYATDSHTSFGAVIAGNKLQNFIFIKVIDYDMSLTT